MKHCPNCHYEYEDWATTCSDCEVELEAGPPPAPAAPPVIDYGQFGDWVILTNVPNTMMGTLLKDQLEHAGIPVLMKRSRATDVAEWTHNDFAWHDLYVPRRFMIRARRLIDSPPGGRYAARDEVEEVWDDEDDTALEDEDVAASDVPGGSHSRLSSAPPLINSNHSAPDPDSQADAPVAPYSLLNLSQYQRSIARRKDHLTPLPEERRVVPFSSAQAPPPTSDTTVAMEEDQIRDDKPQTNSSRWTQQRIYRLLLGLLFLAWTLPFLLQMLQYFRNAFGQLFP